MANVNVVLSPDTVIASLEAIIERLKIQPPIRASVDVENIVLDTSTMEEKRSRLVDQARVRVDITWYDVENDDA